MLYYPYSSKATEATKHLVFFSSLIMMLIVLVFLIRDEAKIPQRQVTLKIDVKNKINTCEAEEELFKKSFFDF